MATEVFEIARRKSGKCRRIMSWIMTLLSAQGGVGPLGNPPVWTEVLEIRERGGHGSPRVVKNDPGSVFDNVSNAERDYLELSENEFRIKWFDTAS